MTSPTALLLDSLTLKPTLSVPMPSSCLFLSSSILFSPPPPFLFLTLSSNRKCGVAGFTVLAASGDNGVEPNRACTEVFQVYPASSLYVTTVGATAIVKSENSEPIGKDAPPICSQSYVFPLLILFIIIIVLTITLFSACQCSTSQEENGAMHNNSALFDTGGGFSHYNERPSWQDAAVKAYFNSGVDVCIFIYFYFICLLFVFLISHIFSLPVPLHHLLEPQQQRIP